MIKLLIVHYNTPRLTECLVRSVNLFVKDAVIYIFDNSDKSPFKAKFDNVKILDNTKGQIINFDKWLEKYPNKNKSHGRVNKWGSAKHCYSVEKCMELINDNFILLDSDILLKRDISNLLINKSIYCGEVVSQPNSLIKRILPYVCFINVKLCKQNGVHYFNDNYMHGLRKTTNGDLYDTGASFFLSANKYPHTNIKCSDYVLHYGHGSWVKDDDMAKYNENEWLSINKRYWSMEKNKKVVYTCITGGYDNIIEPNVINHDFDYVCFTDNPKMKSNVWEIRPLPKATEGLSQVKKQRYVKLNPHLLFPKHDISIWIDGNVVIKEDLNDFINKTLKDRVSIYVPKHPQRSCIYKEAKAVLAMKKDKPEIVNKQLERYKKEGFPNDFGLLQSNIMLRRHNSKECIKLMEAWWNELKTNSHRDQLSFNYVLWKNSDVRVEYMDKFIYKSKWFFWKGSHSGKNKGSNKVIAPNKAAKKIADDRLSQVKKEVKEKLNRNKEKKNRILETFNVGIYGL